ncbi:MAG: DUF5809 family protein [Halobacteriales archaeon]
MDTEGLILPATAEEAREEFEGLVPAADTVVREAAKAMAFDDEEFDRRLTTDVVATAHEALFASLLVVRIGTAAEFEAWAGGADHEVERMGSDNVDHVVWHAPPFSETAVAATYQHERAAAVATLRRQAFGRIYREVVA